MIDITVSQFFSSGNNVMSKEVNAEVQAALYANLIPHTLEQKQQCIAKQHDFSWCNQAGTPKWSSRGCTCKPCSHGRTGDRCENDPCSGFSEESLCSGNGKLQPVRDTDACTCLCNVGYSGKRCKHSVCDSVTRAYCNGRAQPTNVDGKCECQTCSDGYSGDRCQNDPCFNTNGARLCNNRGFPAIHGIHCICEYCLDGWTGLHCERETCKENQVVLDGKCADDCGVGRFPYETSEGFHCFQCDSECTPADGCTGGGASNCNKCQHFAKGKTCLRSCPHADSPDDLNECHSLKESPMTEFLHQNNLHEYAELIHSERISLRLLAHITQQELQDLGVSSFGDRKRFISAMAKIRYQLYEEFNDLLVELDLNTPLLESGGGEPKNANNHKFESTDYAKDNSGCFFEDSESFTKEFEESDALVDFHNAMCTNCEAFQKSQRDCGGAKRAFRTLSSRFHPDVVQRAFPGCDKTLKAWATAAMMDVAMSINGNCRGKRKRKKQQRKAAEKEKKKKKTKSNLRRSDL